MGLALEVGVLADLIENDKEGADWFREDMERLNPFLESNGLQAHIEPEQCEVWSCDMFGYSGLHYLRRIAAHLDIRGTLPHPGDENASADPALTEYFDSVGSATRGVLSRLLGRRNVTRSYDHLILHCDAEGYYIPQDFADVLFPPEELQIPGGMVGSVQRLRDECHRLSRELELPTDLFLESEELWNAVESQGTGSERWERYGIESYTCIALLKACEHALDNCAVIDFC